MNDYLFDLTGEPDEEVKDFERKLGGLRFRARPLDFSLIENVDSHTPVTESSWLFPRRYFTPAMFAAASVVFAAAALGLWFTWFMSHSPTLVHAPVEKDASPVFAQASDNSSSNDQHELQSQFLNPASIVQGFTVQPEGGSKFGSHSTRNQRKRVGVHGARPNRRGVQPPAVAPEVAADQLLLALGVTEQSLDKAFDRTHEHVQSQLSSVRLPAFITEGKR